MSRLVYIDMTTKLIVLESTRGVIKFFSFSINEIIQVTLEQQKPQNSFRRSFHKVSNLF